MSAPSADSAPEFTAFVANWNGSGVIERCLASLLAAARVAGLPIHVFVTDDASSDGSDETIARLFPEVELLRIERNAGYAEAVNLGMRRIKSPWVFLFNNDLVVEPEYFRRMIEAREDARRSAGAEGLFCIGARTVEWETLESNHAGMNPRRRLGFLSQEGFDAETLTESGFVQAGACLVDREKFLDLGGFAPVFHPGYWEDYDICHQALKHGWRNHYEPRAVAFHWGRRSMRSRLGAIRLSRTTGRNHVLFNWVNLSGAREIIIHFLLLPIAMFKEFAGSADEAVPPGGRAVAAAVGRLTPVLRIRRARVRARLL